MPLFGPPNVEKLRAKGDIKGLIKALDDYDDYRRDAARKALITCGSLAAEPLIAALCHQSAWVRRNAASALGEIGDRRAVDALMLALKDPDWHVCHNAAVSLGLLRDARAVKSLIMALLITGEQLSEDPYGKPGCKESVNGCARQALVSIGVPAVEPLITSLKHDQAAVRRGAAWALGDLGDLRAVEPLITAMQDTDDVVRCNAMYSLGRLGDARAVEAVVRALGDSYELVRKNAKWALKTIGVDARAQGTLVAMLRDLKVRERPFIVEKLDELGWEPDDGEAGAAYWTTKQQWDKCVQIGAPAVETLITELSVQRNIDITETRATIGNARVVHVDIIKALAEIADARAAQALIDVIIRKREPSDKADQRLCAIDDQARKAAAAALGKLGAPAIGPILEAASVHPDDTEETLLSLYFAPSQPNREQSLPCYRA